MNETPEQPVLRGAIVLACGLLALAVLSLGRDVFIPLALAALLCFLLAPAVRALERLRLGRVVSVFVIVLACVGVVGAFGWLVASQVAQLGDDFQTYRHNILAKVRVLDSSVRGSAGRLRETFDTLSTARDAPETQPASFPASAALAADAVEPPHASAAAGETRPSPAAEPVRVEVVTPRDNLIAMVGWILGTVVHPLATAGVTALFVVFFLIYREDLRDRVIRVCGKARISVTTAALADTAQRVTRFIAAQVLANGMIGLAIGLGLFAMGIPNAALWGLIAGVFRFVPYVGAFIAALFPVAQAVAISDGWLLPTLVLTWIVFVDVLSANLVEPWLYGSQTGASPTAIVFSFVLWGWLWGGIGLILATPITVCLVVLGKHIPAFEIFHVLLGDEPVLEPKARFYQRLLATHAKEAIEVARDFAAENSMLVACEQVVLPALAQLEDDRRAGVLDSARVEFAQQTVRELLADPQSPAAEEPDPPDASEPNDAKPLILVVLDRGSFDESVPLMLMRVVEPAPWRLHVLSNDSMSTDVVEQVRALRPSAVVLAAIESRDSSRIRHICARLSGDGWSKPVHIALFGLRHRDLAIRSRMGRAGAAEVHLTLSSLVDALRRIAARTIVESPSENPRPELVLPQSLPLIT